MKKRLVTGLGTLLLLAAFFVPALGAPQEFNFVDENRDPWLKFDLQEGMECLPSPLEEPAAVPEGLEALYQWMQPAQKGGETWFVRMPHGRVLGSISRREMGVNLRAEEMLGLWPHIVTTLAKTTEFVDDKPDNVSILDLGGASWLHIQTKAALDGEKMLSVMVDGLANCDKGILVEVWLVSPADATYRYDDQAYTEMQADRESAEKWQDSLILPLE
ncbi:MAG: hypothetical protein GXY67_04820 [Clostridiales bacterium]|nr:hypothetical protein [Clostridiales bacterium]